MEQEEERKKFPRRDAERVWSEKVAFAKRYRLLAGRAPRASDRQMLPLPFELNKYVGEFLNEVDLARSSATSKPWSMTMHYNSHFVLSHLPPGTSPYEFYTNPEKRTVGFYTDPRGRNFAYQLGRRLTSSMDGSTIQFVGSFPEQVVRVRRDFGRRANIEITVSSWRTFKLDLTLLIKATIIAKTLPEWNAVNWWRSASIHGHEIAREMSVNDCQSTVWLLTLGNPLHRLYWHASVYFGRKFKKGEFTALHQAIASVVNKAGGSIEGQLAIARGMPHNVSVAEYIDRLSPAAATDPSAPDRIVEISLSKRFEFVGRQYAGTERVRIVGNAAFDEKEMTKVIESFGRLDIDLVNRVGKLHEAAPGETANSSFNTDTKVYTPPGL